MIISALILVLVLVLVLALIGVFITFKYYRNKFNLPSFVNIFDWNRNLLKWKKGDLIKYKIHSDSLLYDGYFIGFTYDNKVLITPYIATIYRLCSPHNVIIIRVNDVVHNNDAIIRDVEENKYTEVLKLLHD